jgi:hypothetical protein
MSGALARLLLVSLAWSAAGCQHEHLFAPDRPPRVEGAYVVLVGEPGGEEARGDVLLVRAGAVARDGQVYYRPLTLEQEAQLRRGEPVEGVDALLVEVDTSSEVWSQYGLRGGLIGAGVGLLGAALYLLIGNAQGDPVDGERLTVSGSFVGYLGLQGILWGSLVGIISTQGRTDHRLDP